MIVSSSSFTKSPPNWELQHRYITFAFGKSERVFEACHAAAKVLNQLSPGDENFLSDLDGNGLV